MRNKFLNSKLLLGRLDLGLHRIAHSHPEQLLGSISVK